MYIHWLLVLVYIVPHFCLLIKKPDLLKLENVSAMTNNETLTGTLNIILSLINIYTILTLKCNTFFKI